MSLYSSLLENLQRLNELNYDGFVNKQKSITKLFPKYSGRLKDISANGGVKLVTQLPEVWKFKAASGTKPGKSYDVFLHFKNVKELLTQFVPNKNLWKKDGTGISYNLLAPEILAVVDMAMSCSCPATLYWGQDYIRTQDDAQFGNPETRSPDKRNPGKFGVTCKHGGEVLKRLPMYTSTFASWLKTFYGADILRLVKELQNKEEDIASKEVEGGA
jgi:hypothetical protein